MVCDRQTGETGDHVARKPEEFKASIPGYTWDVIPSNSNYTSTHKKRKMGEGDLRRVLSKDCKVTTL